MANQRRGRGERAGARADESATSARSTHYSAPRPWYLSLPFSVVRADLDWASCRVMGIPPYTPTDRPLKISRILFSFARPRSRHANVRFCTSENTFDVSQYRHTACDVDENRSVERTEQNRERTKRAVGTKPATGMNASDAPRRTLVMIRAVSGLFSNSIDGVGAGPFARLACVANPLTVTGAPSLARRATKRRFSLALTGPARGSADGLGGVMAPVAAAAVAWRVLAVTSTLSNAARPTARGRHSVGSGRTRDGHHKKGVDASSCRCARAVAVSAEVDSEADSREGRSEGVMLRQATARSEASRRTSDAVRSIGM